MYFYIPFFKLFNSVCLKFAGLLAALLHFNIDVMPVDVDKYTIRPASLGERGYFEGNIPEFLSIFDGPCFNL